MFVCFTTAPNRIPGTFEQDQNAVNNRDALTPVIPNPVNRKIDIPQAEAVEAAEHCTEPMNELAATRNYRLTHRHTVSQNAHLIISWMAQSKMNPAV